jgi:rhodanese-related sulfurtransferase
MLLLSLPGIAWAASATDAAPDAFPMRATYGQDQPIDTGHLAAAYDRAVIVDVRSAFENHVLAIDKAVNLPLGQCTADALAALRPKQDARPLVFYCNGTTCEKSYKATALAMAAGFANCFVYDSGIFAWADAHPEHTTFFGAVLPPGELKQTIISHDDFAAKCVKSADFLAHARLQGTLVIDVRTAEDRAGFPLTLPGILLCPLDDLSKRIDAKDPALTGKTLYIIDNVGKEVVWLQYVLERAGITSYWFLAGGVRQWRADGLSGDGTAAAKP